MGDECKDTTMDKIIMLTTSVAPQRISTEKKKHTHTVALATYSFMIASSMQKSKGLQNGVLFS
jgi:hypothetical protein